MRRKALTFAAVALGIVLVVAVVLRLFVYDLATVEGDDMRPGLGPGAWVVVRKGRTPARGDLVLFEDANGTARLRRVVGLPGESIALDRHRPVIGETPAEHESLGNVTYGSKVYERIRETIGDASYEILHDPELRLIRSPAIATGDGYFVLTDNREQGLRTDSRGYGPIAPGAIRGIVVHVLTTGK